MISEVLMTNTTLTSLDVSSEEQHCYKVCFMINAFCQVIQFEMKE